MPKMDTNLTSKLPIREHIKNMKRIIIMVNRMDRTYFLHTSIVHIINVMVPYIELMLSAYILDSIGQRKSFSEIMTVVAGSLAGILILHFIASSVWNRAEVRCEGMYYLYECMTQTKMLDMDFSRIDSPEIKDLRDRINRDNNWGAGIYSVFWQFNAIIFGFFNILGAVIVGAPVIKYLVISEKYQVIFVLIILVILVAAGSKCRVFFKKKSDQFMFSFLKEEEKEEQLSFSWEFSSETGYSYKNGKDIRIYDSYDLMKRWTIEPYYSRGYRERLRCGGVGNAGIGFMNNMVHRALEGSSYLIVTMIALAGAVSVGNVVRFAGCLQKLFVAVYSLSEEIEDFALTARKHISTMEFLEVEDEMYKGKLPVEKRSDNEYQIEFRDVSFRYPGSEQYALKHLSMKLKIGEKLAIVGMNGSGKTTMIKLLCRLYDPDEGEILLNGVDIRKFKQEEYSRLFSVVFQDYTLFPFRLAQNIAVDVEYDSEKVEQCLIGAEFRERLQSLEEGIETYLYKNYNDSGVEISGGEAQKIAIARAIYKEAPFILLDEPTAALDPLAEYEIYKNFDKIAGDKTAIYISHRLSSCRFCKKIAVFHEGALVQLGSHDELVADEKGKYYEMWAAQAQYYQEAECNF